MRRFTVLALVVALTAVGAPASSKTPEVGDQKTLPARTRLLDDAVVVDGQKLSAERGEEAVEAEIQLRDGQEATVLAPTAENPSIQAGALVVASVRTSDYIDLSWNRVDGASTYTVRRNGDPVSTSASRAWRDNAPSSGVAHYTVSTNGVPDDTERFVGEEVRNEGPSELLRGVGIPSSMQATDKPTDETRRELVSAPTGDQTVQVAVPGNDAGDTATGFDGASANRADTHAGDDEPSDDEPELPVYRDAVAATVESFIRPATSPILDTAVCLISEDHPGWVLGSYFGGDGRGFADDPVVPFVFGNLRAGQLVAVDWNGSHDPDPEISHVETTGPTRLYAFDDNLIDEQRASADGLTMYEDTTYKSLNFVKMLVSHQASDPFCDQFSAFAGINLGVTLYMTGPPLLQVSAMGQGRPVPDQQIDALAWPHWNQFTEDGDVIIPPWERLWEEESDSFTCLLSIVQCRTRYVE